MRASWLGSIALVLIVASPALGQSPAWIQTRDDFLKDPAMHALLMGHCQRGRAANQAGLSLFNDAWVKSITKLRFEAGVDSRDGATTKTFLAGLSAAVSRACPGVW